MPKNLLLICKDDERMESYRTLYRLRVQHDYFEGRPCDAIGCRLSPQGTELARQRHLLFRRTAADEWAVAYDCNGAAFSEEGDTLTLELYLADPNFTLYTAWQEFRPSDAYELELPGTEPETDAAKAIQPSDKRRKIGSGFCSVSLRLTNEMRQKASENRFVQTVLHFHARSVKWEYIFFRRNAGNIPENGLKLEDENQEIVFGELKPITAYGREGMVATTETAIPMRASYRCRLRLKVQTDGRQQKRILLSRISPPEPGRYQSGQDGIIRQVCYL